MNGHAQIEEIERYDNKRGRESFIEDIVVLTLR